MIPTNIVESQAAAKAVLEQLRIAQAAVQDGDLNKAADLLKEALPEIRHHAPAKGHLMSLYILAQHAKVEENFSLLNEYIAEALPLAYQLDDQHKLATLLLYRGWYQMVSQEFESCKKSYIQALSFARQSRNYEIAVECCYHLGYLIHREELDPVKATPYYQEILKYARQLPAKDATYHQGHATLKLGKLAHESGRLREAVSHYETALATARKIGEKSWEKQILGLLTLAHTALGAPKSAAASREAAKQL